MKLHNTMTPDEQAAMSAHLNRKVEQELRAVFRPVRGPSKREIKWLVKTLKLRNPHFFTGILPAEDVAMTCVLVWLGILGMRLAAASTICTVCGSAPRRS